ncbi:MAG: DUF2854 domain-containing protein [Spirulina sp.]
MFGKIPLAFLGLSLGGILTIMGFVAYALGKPTLNLIGFFYGLPLLLGGLALKASELKPVPYSKPTAPEVLALREEQATEIQRKLRKDVTRYRYGQQVHLDYSLTKLAIAPFDEELPNLQGLREEAIAGSYALILEFYSPFVPLEDWQEKQEQVTKFFGPGIHTTLTQPREEWIELALITTGETDAG